MAPFWLFEADVFGTTAEPLKDEIRRQGMACGVTRQNLLKSSGPDQLAGRRIVNDDCVLGFGSFPFIRHIQLQRRWRPGAWCDVDNLACSTYYPHFNRFLLNRQSTILPAEEACVRVDELYARFGKDGVVFVRPDSCVKTFTGRLVQQAEFVPALAPARHATGSQVVVAEPAAIEREWRVVVAERAFLTAGQYSRDGQIDLSPGCPPEVASFVEEMVGSTSWQPDVIYFMDVCSSANSLHLLELSGFSNSALYPCDYAKVVETAGRLARRAHES